MGNESLRIHARPSLHDARMIIGLSGWMDGGDVSTGTVQYLAKKFDAELLAEIDPSEFYIYNFPGSMELSALFRPRVRIEDGLITGFQEPVNVFSYSEKNNLILFEGKEPNLHWKNYAECVLTVVSEFDVRTLCFVGSVASLIPHTREPHFHSSISEESLRPVLERFGLSPSNYEGPASIVTYLARLSPERGVKMATIVAEIPAYVQGKNVTSLQFVTQKAAEVLDLTVDLSDLKEMSESFERRLNETIQERPELEAHIRKMEEQYDKEEIDTLDTDLEAWFAKQGIRLN